MSEENKEPVKENPPPANPAAPASQEAPASAIPPVAAAPSPQTPVEGPRRILQELEKATSAQSTPPTAEPAASTPESVENLPASESPKESDAAPAASAPTEPQTTEPAMEVTPAPETQAPAAGMPLITDAMRRLDELLSRFR